MQHIFSDKTGTLTENKMIFRKCTINGIDYNHASTEQDQSFSNPNTPAPPIIVNSKLMEDMCQTWNGETYSQHAQQIQEFFLVLSICNTVVVSATPHRDMMNASGIVEHLDEHNGVRIVKPNELNGQQPQPQQPNHINSNNLTVMGDKYTRLTESRSITPSPPPAQTNPPNTLSIKAQHIPSLSPINSSAESSPTSDSPPMKVKSNNNSFSPSIRAKSIIQSKITTLTSMLNNKSHNKRISSKLK